MSNTLRFVVAGTPRPAGSKRYVGRSAAGRGIIVDMSGKPGADWRKMVAAAALQARQDFDWDLIRGPVCLDLIFRRIRPTSHLRRGGGLRPSAPAYPATRPDRGKLARAVEDALTGVLYADDAQIVAGDVQKLYGNFDGVEVSLTRL